MSKYAITAGVQDSPVKTVLYGPEGIGKSTFASHFPDPCSSTPRAAPSG